MEIRSFIVRLMPISPLFVPKVRIAKSLRPKCDPPLPSRLNRTFPVRLTPNPLKELCLGDFARDRVDESAKGTQPLQIL